MVDEKQRKKRAGEQTTLQAAERYDYCLCVEQSVRVMVVAAAVCCLHFVHAKGWRVLSLRDSMLSSTLL